MAKRTLAEDLANYAAAKAAVKLDDSRMTDKERDILSTYLRHEGLVNGFGSTPTLFELSNAPDSLEPGQRCWIASFRKSIGSK